MNGQCLRRLQKENAVVHVEKSKKTEYTFKVSVGDL